MRTNVMNALIHPFHVLMLIVSAVSGLIAAWWLFPLGLVFWLVMVLLYVNAPANKLNQKMEDREPLSPRFQTIFTQIERSQIRMFNSLGKAPGSLRRELQPVLDDFNSLVDQAYLLCARMTPLESFRQISNTQSNLQMELEKLNGQIDKANDPVTRKAYEDARQALCARMEQAQQTSLQLDRAEAFLAGLSSELNMLLGSVIAMQSMKAKTVRQQVPSLKDRIAQELAELQAFENDV